MSKSLEINWAESARTYVNTKISTSPIPIHPHYAEMMNPNLIIGDLVETCMGQIGLVKGSETYPREGSIYIQGANNQYYKILINGIEKIYVGYSLKKI
jgi:hypothetical protein